MIINVDQYRHPSGPHGRVVTVVNGKGGTNKSTTVVALAALAAENGHRVLVVEAAHQGTDNKWFGQPRTTREPPPGGSASADPRTCSRRSSMVPRVSIR